MDIPVEQREKIVAAACRLDGLIYSLPAPARHGHILELFSQHYPAGALCCEQGFLTSAGRFLDRTVARHMAIDAKQVKDMSVLHSRELFSEDLW